MAHWICLNYLGDYKSAIAYLLTGSQIEGGDLHNTINNLIWLAYSYQSNGQPDEACATFKKTLELSEKADYPWAINVALEGLRKCP